MDTKTQDIWIIINSNGQVLSAYFFQDEATAKEHISANLWMKGCRAHKMESSVA